MWSIFFASLILDERRRLTVGQMALKVWLFFGSFCCDFRCRNGTFSSLCCQIFVGPRCGWIPSSPNFCRHQCWKRQALPGCQRLRGIILGSMVRVTLPRKIRSKTSKNWEMAQRNINHFLRRSKVFDFDMTSNMFGDWFIGKMLVPLGWGPLKNQAQKTPNRGGYFLGPNPLLKVSLGGLNS